MLDKSVQRSKGTCFRFSKVCRGGGFSVQQAPQGTETFLSVDDSTHATILASSRNKYLTEANMNRDYPKADFVKLAHPTSQRTANPTAHVARSNIQDGFD
jgi:hypothetical protein